MMERAGTLHSERHPFLDTRRLWSLWDMMKVSASDYLALGVSLETAARILMDANDIRENPYGRDLTGIEVGELKEALETALAECKKLKLTISSSLIHPRTIRLPRTADELDVLKEAIEAELSAHLFLFVPPERAKYYDLVLQSTITVAFPSVSQELVSAGNCIAAGLFTAAVFHSMRAAEIGVRVLGRALGVTFKFGIDLAEWSNVLDQIEAKIKDMKQLPKGPQKDEDLRFYSEAAAQFRYFKDGWRVRVAHARATFEERPARDVFDHTMNFFAALADKLRE